MMKNIWRRRLWSVGAVLLAISSSALGLAAVLFLAGDAAGQQFACGVAAVTGLGFVVDLLALVSLSAVYEGDRVIDRPS
jgi:hypothetical protein